MSTTAITPSESVAERSVERLPNGMRVAKMPNLDWYSEHFDELMAEYPGEWIAIADQRLLAHAKSPESLAQVLRTEHPGTSALIVRCSLEAWAPYK